VDRDRDRGPLRPPQCCDHGLTFPVSTRLDVS
jgi:hypothetical protein